MQKDSSSLSFVKQKNLLIPKEKIYFNKYEGYLTTLEGPMKNNEELKKVAEDPIFYNPIWQS